MLFARIRKIGERGAQRYAQVSAGVSVSDRENVDPIQVFLCKYDPVNAGAKRECQLVGIKVRSAWRQVAQNTSVYSRGRRNRLPWYSSTTPSGAISLTTGPSASVALSLYLDMLTNTNRSAGCLLYT